MGIAYNTSIVRSGLVLHLDAANPKSYPGTGASWKDLSGNGNDGTLVNGVGYNAANNGSMVFDGVNDYIDCGNTSSFNITGPITLAAWVNISGWNNYPGIITKGYAVAGGYSLHIRPDYSLWFEIDEANSTRHIYNPSNIKISLNNWVYTTATYDGSTMRVYLNTVESGAGQAETFTAGIVSNSVMIANSQYAGGTYIQGNIPIAQIYNRALTAAEIKQNFEALRGRYGI